MRIAKTSSSAVSLGFRSSQELQVGAMAFLTPDESFNTIDSRSPTPPYSYERTSGFQQGRCGRRSLRDAANLENEDAGACDFDCDRKDG
jgi:hypothetical protein